MTPLAEDLAYFAGLLDGEGCVRVGKYQAYGEIRYRAYVQIAMTDRAPIDWLAETFGGGVYVDQKKNHPQSKPCFVWTINAREAAKLLQQVLHRLLVKREQAQLLIEFAETLEPGRRHTVGGKRCLPPEIAEARALMHERSRALNHRGVA